MTIKAIPAKDVPDGFALAHYPCRPVNPLAAWLVMLSGYLNKHCIEFYATVMLPQHLMASGKTMKTVFLSGALLIAGTMTAFACPDPSAMGERHDLSGSNLYSPKIFKIEAGGDIDILECSNIRMKGDSGDGYVIEEPDFSFKLSGMDEYSLNISTESSCDTILLVNTASGSWIYDDDDGDNWNAEISLSRPSDGWLDVWVGTHNGDYCSATLKLETFNR